MWASVRFVGNEIPKTHWEKLTMSRPNPISTVLNHNPVTSKYVNH